MLSDWVTLKDYTIRLSTELRTLYILQVSLIHLRQKNIGLNHLMLMRELINQEIIDGNVIA